MVRMLAQMSQQQMQQQPQMSAPSRLNTTGNREALHTQGKQAHHDTQQQQQQQGQIHATQPPFWQGDWERNVLVRSVKLQLPPRL
jgi:hypothetical protein